MKETESLYPLESIEDAKKIRKNFSDSLINKVNDVYTMDIYKNQKSSMIKEFVNWELSNELVKEAADILKSVAEYEKIKDTRPFRVMSVIDKMDRRLRW